MIRVAIVEDNPSAAELIESYLKRYGEEHDESFSVEKYGNAINFIENYNPSYDIIFMDIELPHMDGMTAAKLLRKQDNLVTLIFVTNMAQFAIKGYEVEAMDFIVKPVEYNDFTFRIDRAIARVKLKEEKFITLHDTLNGAYVKIVISHIKYVEIVNHTLVYHCEEGVFESYGTLKSAEKILPESNFARCNSCYLVNLRYVNSVKDFICFVDGEKLKISQPKKKSFMKALNDYICGGIDV